jgi:hypothetical protein
VADGTELVEFAGGVEVKGWGFTGFGGRGTVSVGREGIEFRLNSPFGSMAHRYVKRAAGLAGVSSTLASRRPRRHWRKLE